MAQAGGGGVPSDNTRNRSSRKPSMTATTSSATPVTATTTATMAQGGTPVSTAAGPSTFTTGTTRKQACTQREVEARALCDRVDDAVQQVMRELVCDTITVGELSDEADSLNHLGNEVRSMSVATLTPTKRSALTQELLSRETAIHTMSGVLQAKIAHMTRGATSALGAAGPQGGSTARGAAAPSTAAATYTSVASVNVSAASVASGQTGVTASSVSTPISIPSTNPALQAGAAASLGGGLAPWGHMARGASTTGGGSSHSVPSWATGASNPFDPNRCALGAAYYLSFPPPWNVLPQAMGTTVGELLKVAPSALPRFNGERRAYLAWRSAFIPCVHLTTVNLSYKVMLLRSSMETTSPRMQEFVQSILCTPEGYREAVRQLESRYGGEENQLITRYEELLALPVLKEGDFQTLEALATRLQTYLLEWGATGVGDAESLALFTSLMGRIDRRFGRRYIHWVEDRGRDRGLRSLHVWLKEQLEVHRTVEQYYRMLPATETKTDREGARPRQPLPASCNDKNYKKDSYFYSTEEKRGNGERPPGRDGNRLHCPICRAPHKLGTCVKFKDMTPTERKSVLARDRRCFLCFQKGHLVTKCNMGIKCNTCQKKHHTLLHGAERHNATALLTTEMDAPPDDVEGAFLQHALLTCQKKKVSLRTLVLWAENPITGRGCQVNALLDDGCTTAALVSRDVASYLQLKGDPVEAHTEGVGGHITHYQTVVAPLSLAPESGGEKHLVPAQVMERPAGSYVPVDWSRRALSYPNFAGLAPRRPLPGGIQLLVGSRFPHLSLSLEERTTSPGGPVARRTPLGWTITGPIEKLTSEEHVSLLASGNLRTLPPPPPPLRPDDASSLEPLQVTDSRDKHSPLTDKQLVRLVRRMLEVEDPGGPELLSPSEEYVVTTLRKSLCLGDGRYQAPCVWSPGAGRPSFSFEAAYRRRTREGESGV